MSRSGARFLTATCASRPCWGHRWLRVLGPRSRQITWTLGCFWDVLQATCPHPVECYYATSGSRTFQNNRVEFCFCLHGGVVIPEVFLTMGLRPMSGEAPGPRLLGKPVDFKCITWIPPPAPFPPAAGGRHQTDSYLPNSDRKSGPGSRFTDRKHYHVTSGTRAG